MAIVINMGIPPTGGVPRCGRQTPRSSPALPPALVPFTPTSLARRGHHLILVARDETRPNALAARGDRPFCGNSGRGPDGWVGSVAGRTSAASGSVDWHAGEQREADASKPIFNTKAEAGGDYHRTKISIKPQFPE